MQEKSVKNILTELHTPYRAKSLGKYGFSDEIAWDAVLEKE